MLTSAAWAVKSPRRCKASRSELGTASDFDELSLDLSPPAGRNRLAVRNLEATGTNTTISNDGNGRANPRSPLIPERRFQKRSQPMTSARVPQFPQRLRLNLPDALARHREMLTDFFQSVLAPVLQPEPHLDDLLLARA